MDRAYVVILVCTIFSLFNLTVVSSGKEISGLTSSDQYYRLDVTTIKTPSNIKNLNVAVDDFDKIYICHNATVMIYGKNGENKANIELKVADKKTIGRLAEVSSDGGLFFIESNSKPYDRIFVFNNNGNLVNTISYDAIFRMNNNNIYRAEKYSRGKKIEMHALNSGLDKLIDFSSYYLPKDKINQKPVGFIDNNMSLYYMWYWPDFVKVGPSGEIVSKQKVAYDAEFWRLIGIDSKNILYALVTRNKKSEIVKFNDKAKVITSIAIENKTNISKIIDNAEEGDAETYNYIVIGNGNIYIKNAYPVKKKKGEYAIYRFEQQLQK